MKAGDQSGRVGFNLRYGSARSQVGRQRHAPHSEVNRTVNYPVPREEMWTAQSLPQSQSQRTSYSTKVREGRWDRLPICGCGEAEMELDSQRSGKLRPKPNTNCHRPVRLLNTPGQSSRSPPGLIAGLSTSVCLQNATVVLPRSSNENVFPILSPTHRTRAVSEGGHASGGCLH